MRQRLWLFGAVATAGEIMLLRDGDLVGCFLEGWDEIGAGFVFLHIGLPESRCGFCLPGLSGTPA